MIPDPTLPELRNAADQLRFRLSDEEIEGHRPVVTAALEGLRELDGISDSLPEVRYPRTPGREPTPEENPLGAWRTRTEIQGAGAGPLAGKTVAIKDNVMVAGVPMENGTPFLTGYLPPMDATVVTRILDAGATITGKAVCEAFCFSGGSHTACSGPVHNPHNPEHVAGGSSSGSAALVAGGAVDMAVGGDQGGSIRIPAAVCGIVGMKPTYGLVPYTGALPLLGDADHLGPMTSTVEDNALLLEVLAGPDGYDLRQAGAEVKPYRAELEAGVSGLRVGILEEAFGVAGQLIEVEEKTRAAADSLAALGAKVSSVSVPLHRLAGSIGFGTLQAMLFDPFSGGGFGLGPANLQVTSYVDRARGVWDYADSFPTQLKTLLLTMEHVRTRAGYHYVAKARNLTRQLRVQYDNALSEVDLLLLPTIPATAPRIPDADAAPDVMYQASYSLLTHTFGFNVTHHPALTVPSGMVGGLPVGLMLVGRHWDEPTLYRAAYAFQEEADWRRR